jgi:hypothetical protein
MDNQPATPKRRSILIAVVVIASILGIATAVTVVKYAASILGPSIERSVSKGLGDLFTGEPITASKESIANKAIGDVRLFQSGTVKGDAYEKAESRKLAAALRIITNDGACTPEVTKNDGGYNGATAMASISVTLAVECDDSTATLKLEYEGDGSTKSGVDEASDFTLKNLYVDTSDASHVKEIGSSLKPDGELLIATAADRAKKTMGITDEFILSLPYAQYLSRSRELNFGSNCRLISKQRYHGSMMQSNYPSETRSYTGGHTISADVACDTVDPEYRVKVAD